jgi:Arylsulfotransferase (ASST)/Secretion system C-terminal sorting domain
VISRLHAQFISLFVVAVLCSSSQAIEVALPSDFFTFTVDVPGEPPTGYYYLNPFVENASQGPRVGFELVLDSLGEVVLFRNQGPMTNFHAIEHSQQYSYGYPASSFPEKLYLMDSGWEVIREIPREHPTEPNLILDGHEHLFMEDGTTWSEWWDIRDVDMSQYLEGGQENVEVLGHAVQHWDVDGSILFDWRSWDHLDEIPFTARPDCTSLYTETFEHLHINSIDVKDDFIYLSARFTSVVYKVSRATGEVIWGCGTGPGNDFTFTGTGINIPLDFNYQHDCRILDNGNLTVFDNGNGHRPDYAYAKEYTLDEDNMVADLVWWLRNDPPSRAAITGSHQKLANGNHVVGWGNINPAVAAIEVDSLRNVIWKLAFDRYIPLSRFPGTYRVNKSEQFTPSYRPYVSYSNLGDSYEIQCNWFGHEEEVAGYNLYGGSSEDDMVFWDITTTGHYIIENPSPFQSYFIQIVAIDEMGNEISDVSNLLQTEGIESILTLSPVGSTSFPPEGGTLTFDVSLLNPTQYTLPGIRFTTRVVLPDETIVGPLSNVQFQLSPFEERTVENLTLEIPGFAPEGDYLFTAKVEKNIVEFSDSFPFDKTGVIASSSSYLDPDEWISGFLSINADFADNGLGSIEESYSLDNYSLSTAYPNPFNATTQVSLSLPYAADVTVSVFNISGQRVAMLASGQLSAGIQRLQWDASEVASGVYFIQAHVPGKFHNVQKILLLK